ncbi:CRP-like cAMP-binding protein [Sphingomonas zeicaulis]|uniref:Crp/Fnr family transcriptional regulator n=1 Tax=Sphingomonas zeicaulis TaxID=1632740 RepID=UPI003D1C0E80
MAINATELAGIIAKNSMLASCETDELEDILSRARLLTMKKGETLLNQGDDGDSLIILLEGTVRISMATSNGREIVLNYCDPGEVVGEIALLDGEPRTASATAMTPGRYLRISRSAFEATMERFPRWSMRLLRQMANRLRQTNSMIENDRAFTSGPRLARYIQRLMLEPANDRLRLDLSQSELGNFAGISRENINRQLSAWSDSGIIALESGRIRVTDYAILSRIATSSD